MFAQIVDLTRGVVVGNQVTPLPITLDGASHTVSRPLEGIAASLNPSSKLVLQVIGGSQVYGPVRTAAAVQIAKARLEIPTAGARSRPQAAACSSPAGAAARAGAS